MATLPERHLAGSQRGAPAGSGADPAQIRAIAFAASLGPQRPPRSSSGDDILIDLAGEEALVEFLMRITPVDVND